MEDQIDDPSETTTYNSNILVV